MPTLLVCPIRPFHVVQRRYVQINEEFLPFKSISCCTFLILPSPSPNGQSGGVSLLSPLDERHPAGVSRGVSRPHSRRFLHRRHVRLQHAEGAAHGSGEGGDASGWRPVSARVSAPNSWRNRRRADGRNGGDASPQEAGFIITSVQSHVVSVEYRDIFQLMHHLQVGAGRAWHVGNGRE